MSQFSRFIVDKYGNDKKLDVFQVKYFGAGLIWDENDYGTLKESNSSLRDANIEELKGYNKSTIWTDYIQSTNGSIQVSLENPWYELGQKKNWTTEEQISIIRKNLFNSAMNQPDSRSWAINKDKFIKALTILENEIDEIKKSGNFSGTFPKWEEALSEYITLAYQETYLNTEVQVGIAHALSKKALLLYNASLDALTNEDLWDAEVYELVDPDYNSTVARKGKITLKNQASSLTLELRCNNYDQEYHALVKDKTLPEIFSTSPISFDLDKNMIPKEEQQDLENLLKDISENEKMISTNTVKYCELHSYRDFCSNQEFLARLGKTRSIKASSCLLRSDQNIQLLKDDYAGYACLIIEFKEDASQFLVYSKLSSYSKLSEKKEVILQYAIPIGPPVLSKTQATDDKK